MREFIDKLIERLEEQAEQSCMLGDDDVWYDGMESGYLGAIEIVNELAEEHNGGWIPCSERLPELTEGTEYFKQSPCCLVTLKWWDGDMTESIGWYNQSGVWNDDSKNCKVIAWQPLPQPYVPKG